MSQEKYVTYLRVSTARQGESQLGLSAQRKSVDQFLKTEKGIEVASFTEVESGKRSGRPMFEQACTYAELSNACLLVSRLDRLSRDTHLISGLAKRGIRFRICTLPQADPLTISILSALAEHEGRLISQRTKESLAIARSKGVRMGNPFLDAQRNHDIAAANAARSERQREFKSKIRKVISHLEQSGFTSNAEIAQQLNELQFVTYKGRAFSTSIVSKLRATPIN